MTKSLPFAYFGGEPLGVPVLEELKVAGLIPSLIVCNPDRAAGRGRRLTPPPVKTWAQAHNIPTWQPEEINNKDQILHSIGVLTKVDLFVVVAYNKILPEWLIELPKHKTINVHPSLLPKLRGASPIRTAILEDLREQVGISIMLMDKKMDHGPLLAQSAMPIADERWPVDGPALDEALARMGGAMLAATIPEYIDGEITPTPQDHDAASYCGRLTKDMAELALDPSNLPTGDEAKSYLRVIQAFKSIGNAWFTHGDVRFKVMAAHVKDDALAIDSLTPAGKKEMSWSDCFK